MMNFTIIGGLDVGNGYTKGVFGDQNDNVISTVDMHSCAGAIFTPNLIKPTGEAVEYIINDIYNKADVSFKSSLVKESEYRYFLGRRAVRATEHPTQFNMSKSDSKAKQSLSSMLVLGTSACCALQHYYKLNNKLPDEAINVEMNLGLALPISEYVKYRESYAQQFLEGIHTVTFHNFDKEININIKFMDIQVLAEGSSAQFAINNMGTDFVTALLNECRKYMDINQAITADDIIKARSTVGIDIGEGTINFPVYMDGIFDPDYSTTFGKGYGSVLQATLDETNTMGYPFKSRKDLAEYIERGPSNITKDSFDKVAAIMDNHIHAFVEELKYHLSILFDKVATTTEVIYIYGGGATPLRDELYPVICDFCKRSNIVVPILYLDSKYSRLLNREGLYLIEKSCAKKSN